MRSFKNCSSYSLTMGKEDDVGNVGPFNYSGYFKFSNIYKIITRHAKEGRYLMIEPWYKDKTGGAGNEKEIRWYMENKVDRMHKYILVIDYIQVDGQVMKDDPTGKTMRGRFVIKMEAKIDRDYQGLFESSPMKYFWGIYDRLVGRDYFYNHWDVLYNEMYSILADIKKELKVDTR